MKQAYEIAQVVPHSGTMSLLDNIIDYDDESLSASVSISANSLFVEERGVPAMIGIEYMAQAIAAYAGVQDKKINKEVSVGFLLGSRKYTATQPFFPMGAALTIAIERELQGENGLVAFQCEITGPKGIQAEARLVVFQPDNVEDFLNN